jgi:hypothetical protein
MYFVKIGDRAINLDNVAQIEPRNWNEGNPTTIHFVGQGHNSPLVLSDAEAMELHNYLEYGAERPIGTP